MIKDPEFGDITLARQPDLTDYLNMKNDSDIVTFCANLFSLIHDGVSFRQEQVQQGSIKQRLNQASKARDDALRMFMTARDFIKEHELHDEFNQYCMERNI